MSTCFASTPRDINLFRLTPDGAADQDRGKLRIETQTGDDITGHRVEGPASQEVLKEYFTGKCRIVNDGAGGTVKLISFVIPLETRIYFFVGAFNGLQVRGVYHAITRISITATGAAALVDPGDTGTWGGSQT